MIAPTHTFVTDSVKPVGDLKLAGRRAVRLPAGVNYPMGQILGEVQTAQRNEVQTLTLGTATGGSYKLLFPGDQQTALVAYNANAAAIQAAIQAVLGTGAAVVTGTGPFPLTYSGAESTNRELGPPQVISFLTGGSAPAIAQTTPGSPGPVGCFAAYTPGATDGRQTALAILEHTVLTDFRGCVRDRLGATDEITAMAWTTGEFLTCDAAGNLLLPGLDATAVGQLGKLVSGSAYTVPGATLRIR